jgi:subtilisin family serine protease
MILYNQAANVTDLETDNHYLPTIHLQFNQGEQVLAFLAANTNVQAALTEGQKVTAQGDVMASFSSRGPSRVDGQIKPDLAAPGAEVRSSWPTNVYATVSGTSMASPHTAGTVALLWAAQPGYRANIGGTEQLIKESAVRLTTSTETCGGLSASVSPNNTYGWGRVDALAAISGTGPVNQPPVVSISAPSNGAAVNCGVSVTFTATASDPDGAAPSIQWTENGVHRFRLHGVEVV